MSASATRWRPTPLVAVSIALHVLAIGVLLASPDDWPWVLGAILCNHLLFTALGLWPRSRLLGANWTRLPDAAAARGEIALTIDDGPDPVVTPQVLDILERYGVAATFFCIGGRAVRHPDLVRDIVRRGHAVENHSDRHAVTFALMGVGAFVRELQAAQSALAGITGRPPQFFRAPAGLRSPLLDPALVRVGLRLATWTRRGFDTLERNPDKVAKRLLRNLRAGDILLLHDGNAARTSDGVPVIVAVLPGLLDAIRRAGLSPVTLAAALR
ncbi:MAG: polysaccharide deacetylase family protein [Betaproteobacteria bacterium]